MSHYQYCTKCDNGIDPTPDEIIDRELQCGHCGEENKISYGEEERNELLKAMYHDIKLLKETQT